MVLLIFNVYTYGVLIIVNYGLALCVLDVCIIVLIPVVHKNVPSFCAKQNKGL